MEMETTLVKAIKIKKELPYLLLYEELRFQSVCGEVMLGDQEEGEGVVREMGNREGNGILVTRKEKRGLARGRKVTRQKGTRRKGKAGGRETGENQVYMCEDVVITPSALYT